MPRSSTWVYRLARSRNPAPGTATRATRSVRARPTRPSSSRTTSRSPMKSKRPFATNCCPSPATRPLRQLKRMPTSTVDIGCCAVFGKQILDTPAAIRRTAMDLLARREHSYAEMLRKLRQRGAATELAEIELDRLQEQGLLSDERFCEAYVYSRSQRGYGPVRLREE